MTTRTIVLAGVLALILAGCGDDEVAPTTNNGSANNGASNNGGSNNGGSNNGATNNGATNNGATDCGNGTIDAGEACDDGNPDADDGCSAACAVERLGGRLVDRARGDVDAAAVVVDPDDPWCGRFAVRFFLFHDDELVGVG